MIMYRISPANITELYAGQMFVFGSNELGAHGAGAAEFANRMKWARNGQGIGPFWKYKTQVGSYAIPTKDWQVRTLPLEDIVHYVNRFIAYARVNSSFTFLVTEIGCGYAGYTPEKIAPMFKECLDMKNIYLPQRFIDVLCKK